MAVINPSHFSFPFFLYFLFFLGGFRSLFSSLESSVGDDPLSPTQRRRIIIKKNAPKIQSRRGSTWSISGNAIRTNQSKNFYRLQSERNQETGLKWKEPISYSSLFFVCLFFFYSETLRRTSGKSCWSVVMKGVRSAEFVRLSGPIISRFLSLLSFHSASSLDAFRHRDADSFPSRRRSFVRVCVCVCVFAIPVVIRLHFHSGLRYSSIEYDDYSASWLSSELEVDAQIRPISTQMTLAWPVF